MSSFTYVVTQNNYAVTLSKGLHRCLEKTELPRTLNRCRYVFKQMSTKEGKKTRKPLFDGLRRKKKNRTN